MTTEQKLTTKAYKVLIIDEMSRLADVGGIERYYRSRIKTKGGLVITVDIPEGDFTEEKARPILTQRAENADRVLSSGG